LVSAGFAILLPKIGGNGNIVQGRQKNAFPDRKKPWAGEPESFL
jgi:hypothetical protein